MRRFLTAAVLAAGISWTADAKAVVFDFTATITSVGNGFGSVSHITKGTTVSGYFGYNEKAQPSSSGSRRYYSWGGIRMSLPGSSLSTDFDYYTVTSPTRTDYEGIRFDRFYFGDAYTGFGYDWHRLYINLQSSDPRPSNGLPDALNLLDFDRIAEISFEGGRVGERFQIVRDSISMQITSLSPSAITAVPLPATLPLALAAFGALGFLRWRTRTAA